MVREIVFESSDLYNPAVQFSRWYEQNQDAELVRVTVSYRQKGGPFDTNLARFLRELDELV
jgi:hypothetical protein